MNRHANAEPYVPGARMPIHSPVRVASRRSSNRLLRVFVSPCEYRALRLLRSPRVSSFFRKDVERVARLHEQVIARFIGHLAKLVHVHTWHPASEFSYPAADDHRIDVSDVRGRNHGPD